MSEKKELLCETRNEYECITVIKEQCIKSNERNDKDIKRHVPVEDKPPQFPAAIPLLLLFVFYFLFLVCT